MMVCPKCGSSQYDTTGCICLQYGHKMIQVTSYSKFVNATHDLFMEKIRENKKEELETWRSAQDNWVGEWPGKYDSELEEFDEERME